jgi:hypothetical protein
MCAIDVTRELTGATTAVQAVVCARLKFATDAIRADLDEFEKGCFYLKVEAPFLFEICLVSLQNGEEF